MQESRHRDMRVVSHGIPERQRPMRGQLADEPVGQGLDDVVVVLLRFGLATDGDDGALDDRHGRIGAVGRIRSDSAIAFAVNRNRRFVFGPDIAAIDGQVAIRVDADEDASADDLGRIVDYRPIFEGSQRRLDFAETLIHLFGQFVGVLVFGFELGVFGFERVDRRLFFGREVRWRAFQFAQTMGVAVGDVDRHLNPLPAFGGDGLRLGFQLLGDQAVEQANILQPAAIILLEEIAHDDAASRFIRFEADEHRALVGRPDRALRQHAADLVRLPAVGPLGRLPDLLLTRMVNRHGEGHELVQRHAILGIDVEKLFRDGGKAQSLLHHIHADEEGGGDVLLGLALFT